MWDVFIAHASEDKGDIGDPLVKELQLLGLTVWYDTIILRPGDSLSEEINKGLVHSKFGIVILSRHFFAKKWPQQELKALLEREEDGSKVVIPLWHKITKQEILGYYALIADKIAIRTERGVDKAATEIARVVRGMDDPLVASLRSSPGIIRAEGLSERLNEIVIEIRASKSFAIATPLTIDITTSLNITNRLGGALSDLTDAVLESGDSTILVRGRRTSDSSIRFSPVPLIIPREPGGLITLRISDLRVAVAGTSAANGLVFAFIEVMTDCGVTVQQSSKVVQVGTVRQALSVTLKRLRSSFLSTVGFNCEVADGSKSPSTSHLTARVIFAEHSSLTWLTRAEEDGFLTKASSITPLSIDRTSIRPYVWV